MHGIAKREGVFVFHRIASIPAKGNDVFRLRMIGHEILLPDMHVCNSTTVVAPYRVLIGGTYRVEVLHQFSGFTYDAHPQPTPAADMVIADFELRFFSADEDWGCAWDDGCRACASGDVEGRWVVRTPRALGGQLHHCPFVKGGFQTCNQVMDSLARSKDAAAGMHWQPYHCRVLAIQELDIPACLSKRKLCFVGDSQMRHVMQGVAASLQNDSSWFAFNGTDQDVAVADTQRPLSVGATQYFAETFGEFPHNLTSCSDVIMNFGQWPASYITKSAFWTLPQYRLAVENAADFLHFVRAQGKRVWWLTTNSANTVSGNTGKIDWRSDPVITMYNQLAVAEMGRLDIPIIDAYRIVAPLHDLSFDGYHFKGIVGHNLDLHVLNTLCHGFG